MPAFPEDSVSEAPASPSVLQEATEKEELALVSWMTSQDSRGPPSRLARVSTRTSMRLETETSSGEVAAATLRNGAMTIHNETIADFTFRQPSAREGSASPSSARTQSTPFRETAEPADVEGNGQANLSSRVAVGSSPPSPSRRSHLGAPHPAAPAAYRSFASSGESGSLRASRPPITPGAIGRWF